MRTPRVFHDSALMGKERVALEPQAAKHLLTVLRLKVGAPLTLFDGSGFEFQARIEQLDKKQVWVRLDGAHGPAVESPLRVTLAQGISRGERMDYTVQKAVELGVTEIAPVLTERSVVKLDADNSQRKQEHWLGVVTAACEQSGRVRVPTVDLPVTLPQYLGKQTAPGLCLLLDPLAERSLSQYPAPDDHRVTLLVGPEGGLSDKERELAAQAGFKGMRLGPRILRTETAALVALSLMQSQWGDLG